MAKSPKTTVEIKRNKDNPSDWTLVVRIPGSSEYQLPKSECIVCHCDARHVNLRGSDGRMYSVPRGGLASIKLFPNAVSGRNPCWFAEFRGDPATLRGAIAVVVPTYSAK